MDNQAELDNNALENVANGLGEDWSMLSIYLSFDDNERAAICTAFPNQVNQQANYMLTAWRDGYKGADMLGDLKGALRTIGYHGLLQELGEEILDDKTLKMVAHSIRESWPELALYLCFQFEECSAIQAAFETIKEQAGQMLAAWRQKFTGDNPVEYLVGKLISMERDDIATKIAIVPALPSCSCGNDKVLKFQPYFSKEDDDTSTRLIGIRCTNCGQEWLPDRFLYHPDEDRTRPKIQLRGVVLKKQLEVPMDRNLAFQVNKCRTKINNTDFAGDYLKIGDQITWHRPWGSWHHAVVSEVGKKGRVKIFHWTKSGCELPRIVERWTDLGDEYGDLFRIDYPEEITQVNPAELVIARARSRVGDTGYGLFSDNCEAFAAYCKTGVAESCQVLWFFEKCRACLRDTLVSFGGGVARAGCIVANEYAKQGTKELCKASGKVFAAETLEMIGGGSNALGAFFILYFEGGACVFNLGQYYTNRKSGNMSREDFLQIACRRVFEALCGAGLAIGLGIAGQGAGAAVGGMAGTFLFPGFGTAAGSFLGSIIGGGVGSFIGRPIGSIIGSPIGRVLTSVIGTDDRAVNAIEDVNPGDQVVFYGNLLHPRHHAIVVSCDPAQNKVRVVHNTYSQGVVEELVDFIDPVYRLVYREDACYPPDEVIKRARSKIGDETYKYSLAFNNCKSFARWCKKK